MRHPPQMAAGGFETISSENFYKNSMPLIDLMPSGDVRKSICCQLRSYGELLGYRLRYRCFI